MADTLSFDVDFARNGFHLSGAADIPLQGITGISGNSGSGKTTLLRVLAGLQTGVQARVTYGDEDWSHRPPQDRAVGFVFQDARLFRHLSVARNIRYGAQRRGVAEQTILDVIAAFDLHDLLERRPASLSGGEVRRVALARALASQPRLLFLDEPMVGLDTDRRAEVLPYITRAVDRFGVGVLYVSHSQFEMNLLADRILPIAKGMIGQMLDGPARFNLPVTRSEAGQVWFQVGGSAFSLPGECAPDRVWEIRPGDGAILSEIHPGANSAAAVLPVTIQGDSVAGQRHLVQLAGQNVRVRPADGFSAGQQAWLICPKLRGRNRHLR